MKDAKFVKYIENDKFSIELNKEIYDILCYIYPKEIPEFYEN